MLIRRPIEAVFDAFVNPEIITKFWLQSTTGPLAPNAKLEWQFMVPGANEVVSVTSFHQPRLIEFEWTDGVKVELAFHPYTDDVTCVTVHASNFGPEQWATVVDAAEGFSIVLCDLKTLMETGHSANLVRDKAELIAAKCA